MYFFVFKKVLIIFKLLNVQKSISFLQLLFNVAFPFVPTLLATLLFPTLAFISPINIV